MTSGTGPHTDTHLPLRERKKRRTRRALAETALRLFREQGYEETTLEELVAEVEVSMRTFFRYFSSKEDVAVAAETELWDAWVEEFVRREIPETALEALRDAVLSVLRGMDEEWFDRLLRTRLLAARTPALRERHASASHDAETRLLRELENRLGTDSRTDVRLPLLAEMALSAFRCGGKNWLADQPGDAPDSGRAALVNRVTEAFDALPGSMSLSLET